jgi:hypothetical protein
MSDALTKSDLEEALDGVLRKDDLKEAFADFKKNDLKEVFDDFKKNDLKEMFDEQTAQLVQFFEPRFKSIEVKLDRTATKDQYDHVTNTLDTFLKRTDDQEKDNAVRDRQIARLDDRTRSIAHKTGVELED